MLAGRKSRAGEGNRRGTGPLHRHQFESFTKRISKLSIDPVRRVDYQSADQDDLAANDSYFKNALSHWIDANLSDSFTNFIRDVEPYCDSLPQILYHRAKIVAILHQYLEAKDSLSLEPLLSLQAHLVHDLGSRFEEHFPKTLSIVLSIASKHQDVEVIEWSFSCLAWLFKYLSRLLVPDLRPTYDVVASALGKENHKPFIARFAAEAMSFLIRKAAAGHQKNTTYLSNILDHVLLDVEAMRESRDKIDVYLYGVMTLFASSIKGVNSAFHSSGFAIYEYLLQSAATCGGLEVISGLTVNLIHHADERSFAPILQSVCKHITQLDGNATSAETQLCASLLFIISSVRKGSRVQNWQPVFSCLEHLLEINEYREDWLRHKISLLLWKTTAVALQTAPLDIIISNLGILETLTQKIPAADFLAFCSNFSRMSPERFSQFLKHHFQKFVALHWTDLEKQLLIATSLISQPDDLRAKRIEKPVNTCPMPWAERMIATFDDRDLDLGEIPRLQGYLDLLEHESNKLLKSRVSDSLQIQIRDLMEDHIVINDRTKLLLGAGLHFVLSSPNNKTTVIAWSLVCKAIQAFNYMPQYIENLLLLSTQVEIDSDEGALDSLASILIRNLSSPDKSLRKASLGLLDVLLQKRYGLETDILKIALAIENLSLGVQTARTASMYVRQLSEGYQRFSSIPWIALAIPNFCFGLLHFQLSQLWDDAIHVLRTTMGYHLGEEDVTELAFTWLESSAQLYPRTSTQMEAPHKSRLNEFQCSNLIQTDQNLMAEYEKIMSANDEVRNRFQGLHYVADKQAPNCRIQAFRILEGIPELAEKRSKRIVPLFLSSVSSGAKANARSGSVEGEENEILQDDEHGTATSRSDMLALLGIFGSFKNPRVIYRASEVYDALLNLLSNGDVQIQKATLKAIGTWKLEGFERYRENLFNLLDEARFRDEMSVFVRADEHGNLLNSESSDTTQVLLRLLYGRIIARQGSSSSKNSLSTKRRAVFVALAEFSDNVIRQFVSIVLGSLDNLRMVGEEIHLDDTSRTRTPQQRQQLGLLNMVKDLLAIMGDRLTFCLSPMMKAILYLSNQWNVSQNATERNTDFVSESLQKSIRRIAVQCVLLVFQRFPSSEAEEYLPLVFHALIGPRLAENFANETGQGISGLLQLFSTWATTPDTAIYLSGFDPRILPSLISVLILASARDEVKIFILEKILHPIALLAGRELVQHHMEVTGDDSLRVLQSHMEAGHSGLRVLQPHMEVMLNGLRVLLEGSSKQVLWHSLDLVAALSSLVQGSGQITSLLVLLDFLLRQPLHRVNPRSKSTILQALIHFIPLNLKPSDHLLSSLFESVVPLFRFFNDRESRTKTADTLQAIAIIDSELREVSLLCQDLNSFSSTTLDAPDFERRFRAFQDISSVAQDLSAKQWIPILHNMLFYIKDTQERALRTSASHCIREFIKTSYQTDISTQSTFDTTRKFLLDAARDGMSNPSELVRTEYLAVFGELLRSNPEWDEIKDLIPLLMNDDEEASFFTNILHIQQHRRSKALRRLAAEGKKGLIQSCNISRFLIPLLEHFILDKAADSSAHNLSAEAITTLGALSQNLEWPQFRAIFRRYTGYLQINPDIEKSTVRLLSVFAESLNEAAVLKDRTPDSIGMASEPASDSRMCLSRTMPRQDKIGEDICNKLMPPLQAYIHHKDETLVSQRMPVAIATVKLLKLLPVETLSDRLPPVLTDICQILRSKSEESRDLTRRTLAEILGYIGPKHFDFILKELRTALPRGYQLHVLSYTVHSLLLASESLISPGDIDSCLPSLGNIIMDDIFGALGEEKDAEGYINKMKEISSKKSFNSMEIIAKVIPLHQVNKLVGPLIAFLNERLEDKALKKIDELFRRLGLGLSQNREIGSKEGLILCYELLQQAYSSKNTVHVERKEQHIRRIEIDLKGSRKDFNSQHTTSCLYKLARFSLDLLRGIVTKFDDMRTPPNLAGFMPIVGEALIGAHEEVQNSAMRVLAAIVKVPLKEIDSNAPVYISESIKIIKNATSTSTEIAQAALKLITVMLRERPKVQIRDSDLGYLLQKVKQDIEEPDRQGVTFNFLRAVIQRKILLPEVYEILDSTSAMMITNQSRGSRDTARGLYVQFFINYPQTKGRLKKQLAFLVKNLSYQYPEGRQSVMETIHLLLSKSGEDFVQNLVGIFFVPLVLVSANDDSTDCRKMVHTLLRSLLEKADDERLSITLIQLKKWINQAEHLVLTRIAIQIYGMYIELFPAKGERELPTLLEGIQDFLSFDMPQESSDYWEIRWSSLQLMDKLCQLYPQITYQAGKADLWDLVKSSLTYPHAWVKSASSKLLGGYFADFARLMGQNETFAAPLYGSGGLELTFESMVTISNSSLETLKGNVVSDELATQLVKNMTFLGRLFSAIGEASERKPLGYIFSQISSILRNPATTKDSSLVPKSAAIRLLASLCSQLSATCLLMYLTKILQPLYQLADRSETSPFSTEAHEIISTLQDKVGTGEFVSAMAGVRQNVEEKRSERRIKRKIEAVADPERAGAKKSKKHTKEKLRRKERNGEQRSRRRGW
ncbi:U3 snoRNP protein [Thelotrema lepadinum]|nr:U3 snoRNP protein [Thelotrema lepadinum]